MHLTHYTDYSLRVLMYIAVKPKEDLTQIKEISEAYDISKNHLMKVVYQLGKLGYIETVRGRSGGMRLLKKPEDITIGQLVRQTEDNFHLVECFQNHNTCPIAGACRLQNVLGEALQAYLAVLDGYTLADMTENKDALGRLLNI